MQFNSLQFLIFVPLVTVSYFAIPHRHRWLLLLAASVYFYMTFTPGDILTLVLIVCVTYFTGASMEDASATRKKHILSAAIIVILGLLFYYKYSVFANENIASLVRFLGWNYPIKQLDIVPPIGVSFYTLRSLSYLLEVYNGRQAPERHFGYFALFITFFPQITAGPIERPQSLLPQFRQVSAFETQRVVDGLKWVIWGLYKKIVIADGLAMFVNPIFTKPREYSGPAFAFAAVGYAIQLYADFSGYSDMAFGVSHILGFSTERNFKRPFFAASIMEFWQRWHISLTTWLRDYVFFPLRRKLLRRKKRLPEWLNRAITTITTMAVSGLWHGANWTFIAWGVLHGIYIFVWDQLGELQKGRVSVRSRAGKSLLFGMSVGLTFVLVALSLIIFRSKTITISFYIISHLFFGWSDFFAPLASAFQGATSLPNGIFASLHTITEASRGDIILTTFSLLLLLIVEIMQERGNLLQNFNRQNRLVRTISYSAIALAILLLGTFNTVQEGFIYFQF